MLDADLTVRHYAAIIYYAAHYLARASERHRYEDIAQEGFCWVLENLGAIERWEQTKGKEASQKLVFVSAKRYMTNYIVADDASWNMRVSLAYWSGDEGEQVSEDSILSVAEQLDPEHGTEPEFTEDPDIYRLRTLASAVSHLEPDVIELLVDVFVKGMSYSEAARLRGQHVTSTSARANRAIKQVLASLNEHMDEHTETVNRLRSGYEGFGGRS